MSPIPPQPDHDARAESLDFLRRLTGTPADVLDRARLRDHFAAEDRAEAEAEAERQARDERRDFVRGLVNRPSIQLHFTTEGETK